MKTLYLIDPKIKYETFKMLQEKLVKDSGPTLQHMDEMLWQMVRDKQIYAWFSDDLEGNMGIGTSLPKNVKIIMLKSPKK